MIINMENRRISKQVRVGDRVLGGGAPILVQSMTNCRPDDFEALSAQIAGLEKAGCDIVRLTVPDMGAVKTLARLKESGVKVPLVADIHCDYKMAVEAANAGADKIRINPGNIGGEDKVREVVRACRAHGIPIRVGVNGGSLEKELLEKYGPTPEALCQSAMRQIGMLEKFDFTDIVAAIKSSDVGTMVSAVRLLAARCDYPLHIGVTEAGTAKLGTMKSAAGIGSLLLDGIGDTIRVSLTAPPVLEVREGHALLRALGMDETWKLNLVSCPTCGRTKIDLVSLASALEDRIMKEGLAGKKMTVAVMGCVVNGPGEAKHADVGVAGGLHEALLIRRGEAVRKIPEGEIIDTLIEEIRNF